MTCSLIFKVSCKNCGSNSLNDKSIDIGFISARGPFICQHFPNLEYSVGICEGEKKKYVTIDECEGDIELSDVSDLFRLTITEPCLHRAYFFKGNSNVICEKCILHHEEKGGYQQDLERYQNFIGILS